jgi:hypothetical protein
MSQVMTSECDKTRQIECVEDGYQTEVFRKLRLAARRPLQPHLGAHGTFIWRTV